MPARRKVTVSIDHPCREFYDLGYKHGLQEIGSSSIIKPTKKRKLSAWNKYVKANSNKPRFRLRSGKINLKKMGVAFRKTPAGKKRKR